MAVGPTGAWTSETAEPFALTGGAVVPRWVAVNPRRFFLPLNSWTQTWAVVGRARQNGLSKAPVFWPQDRKGESQ